MERPVTRYAAVGDAQVAYQVVGEGPMDLLYFYGLASHIELFWESPRHVEFFERLASFSRLIMFDRRGTGVSDGVARTSPPTWEEWTEDVRAVLDAAGSTQTAILAANDAGPITVLFAAMHPERVTSLVLLNSTARSLAAADYPIGVAEEDLDALVAIIRSTWGTLDAARLAYASRADDDEFLAFVAMMFRCSVTPHTAAAQFNYLLRSMDVRQTLPLIAAPTLVLNARGSRFVPLDQGRYLADHIAGARFVELPGSDTGLGGELGPLVADEVAQFLTGRRIVPEIERILTTVLFTDIVGSTRRATAMGDHHWRGVLDTHDRVVREQIHRFRGREINTTGDGFVVSFDGPARAVRCAESIISSLREHGLEIRAGLHTGEVEVRGDDLAGVAVHIAARVGALAASSEVLVSSTVKDLVVGSGIGFEDRGEHELRGVPGTWRLFAVAG